MPGCPLSPLSHRQDFGGGHWNKRHRIGNTEMKAEPFMFGDTLVSLPLLFFRLTKNITKIMLIMF